jgi:2Fe-2S iron-sulfur cluster binding domain
MLSANTGSRTLLALFRAPNRYTNRPMSETPELIPQFSSDSDLFDPFDRLIAIEIAGKQVQVPENNRLLRCFQYLSSRTISYGDFCWNGECTNCQIWYHRPGQNEKDDRPVLACRQEVVEGMIITKLSRFIELEGINKRS